MTEPQPNIPFAEGPFLQTAVICERVLEEKDSVKTAVRMIDRVNRTAYGSSPPQDMAPFKQTLTALLRFKSGSARGPMEIQLRLQKPSGESPSPQRYTVHFEGDADRGVDLIVGMEVEFDLPGLHWFDVYLDGIRITRMPMRVVYLPQVMQQIGQPPEHQ